MATSDFLIHVNEGTIFWTPDGGAATEIDCKSCSAKPKAPIGKVIGSKYGRQNKPGLMDFTGELVVYLRRNENPYTLGLFPGAKGTLDLHHYDDANGWADVPVILGEEFDEQIFTDNETDVKVITIPFMLDGDFPAYPTMS
jgi:hypothetical protein